MRVEVAIHPMVQRQGVLVVEDSALQRTHIVEQLTLLGVERIHEAGDGFAALNLVRNLMVPPALIVLDIALPGIDGPEVLEQLAEDGYRPALLIASNSDNALIASVEDKARRLGFHVLGGVHKPIPLDVLAAMFTSLAEHLALRSLRPQSDRAAMTPDALREALDGQMLQPHYQPKIELRTGRLSGFEALARIHDAAGTVILPASFIALAEERGQVGELTLYMLGAVLTDMVTWKSRGTDVSVSLNLSPVLLLDHWLISEIIARVGTSGVSPRKLTFEITEVVLAADVPMVLESIGRLRQAGFAISIDDYGTGFSSMQQLSRIPFTELKIDRVFVTEAPGKPHMAEILRSTFEMARSLGLSTVAEGVETAAELAMLKSMGCNIVQGYHFGGPISAVDVFDWIRENRDRVAALCEQGETVPR
ncbi:EAL domain-containing protein [Jeongeupia naejangsanensis]|uniref:EAL domain-containing response regulator n=1 Tax=Jeongeupia naejangsanensis TaxID=613195 RepID=A0ABS2BGJ5_9NEIS|nr:EAL domain-containing response regulator [Jeongeupia naejangsanensis]MBM3114734.1 EAL domain-containing response regulator [Jeongeupia naejangsanensis]